MSADTPSPDFSRNERPVRFTFTGTQPQELEGYGDFFAGEVFARLVEIERRTAIAAAAEDYIASDSTDDFYRLRAVVRGHDRTTPDLADTQSEWRYGHALVCHRSNAAGDSIVVKAMFGSWAEFLAFCRWALTIGPVQS